MPLLLYMSVAIEDKPALTLKDIVVIGSVVLTVACGFFMNTPGLSPSGAIVLFIAGCFFLGLCMFLGVITQKREERVFDDEDYAKETLARDTQFLAQSAKKRALSRLVILLMPLFPLVNILQYTHVFDRDEGFIAYELLGVVAKLLFLSTMSDAHISLSQTVSILRLSAEEAANATRRTFLRYVRVRPHPRAISHASSAQRSSSDHAPPSRPASSVHTPHHRAPPPTAPSLPHLSLSLSLRVRYVFNEVRGPLNTMAMGMSIVSDDQRNKTWTSLSDEALGMMQVAD